MRYLTSVLVGVGGGLLLAAAVLTVEIIYSQKAVASQIADCVTAGGYVCSGVAQVGGVEVLIAFALGCAAAIMWSRRR